ncbi:interleukin-17C [Thalassophryne amazonica]|uniref:interleukin-17C n=1 Tax=Thalassophryne amazonica TaxID=390379 RepID=UPI001471A603|nr:interleukin-17C [Thalassophryne amazonica]
MDLTQILLCALVLAPVLTSKLPCHDEHELEERAERKLKTHYPQPPQPAHLTAPEKPLTCPLDQYHHTELRGRSLSPWTYVLRTMKDHFPPTVAEAQCLCRGCIITSDSNELVESHDYNSALIRQSRVFLKRELCEDGKKYRLVPVTEQVGVGCTCARPNTI